MAGAGWQWAARSGREGEDRALGMEGWNSFELAVMLTVERELADRQEMDPKLAWKDQPSGGGRPFPSIEPGRTERGRYPEG